MANLGYIQITRNCNQKCRICSNPPSGRRDLKFARIKKLIDDYIKKGYEGLILSGGEPTMHPQLPEIIKYSTKKKFPVRIISNGQKMADKKFVSILAKSGLEHACISIYSNKKETQSYLTQNENALENIKLALDNLIKAKIRIDICIAISKLNSGHLSSVVGFILKNYPQINHFVFNNLDPTNDRVKENPHTIPKLNDFALELARALDLLEKSGKTFRVERVPLCYLPQFEYCSTETRKIVKSELRPIYFLDEKGFIVQEGFSHQKSKRCKACSLNDICAGLFGAGKYFSLKELYPVFVPKEGIIKKIE